MAQSRNACETDHIATAAPETSGVSPVDVLDLEGLRNRCMGNIDLVQRVLDKFQQRVPEELAELEKLLALGDIEQLARVAHRVKGTSANAAADGLRRAAAEIEDSGRAGRLNDVSNGIEHLRDEWEKYLDYASTLLSALDASGETGRLPTSAQP
jgi:HPt (histidine-containing phosphotransfer) domain-containing protein